MPDNNPVVLENLLCSPDQATIAPFWDDLVIDSTGNPGVFWEIKGSGDDQRMIIQWNEVRFYGSSGADPITFQAVMAENSGNPYIQFNYLDLDGGHSGDEGASATVGIKAAGAQGLNRLLVSQNAGPNQYVGTGLSTRIAVGLAPDVETPDYYAFHLDADERATVVLNAFGGNAQLDLQNMSGTSVGTTVSAGNVDVAIEFAGAVSGATYYAVVTGDTRVEYNLVVTRGAYFELENNSGPEPWLGVDPAQTIELNSAAVVLGSISGGSSGGDAVVGYFTDNNTGSTGPAAPITPAGFTAVQITNIGTFDLGTIDILMVDEASNSGLSSAMLGRLGDIEVWVETGGVFIVHDRFVSTGPAEPNPFVIGAPGTLVDRDFTNDADINVIPPGTTLVTDGPFGVIDDSSLDGGNSSTHGFADGTTLPADAVSILSAGTNTNNVAAFSYPLVNGFVYYSTIPLDFYLDGNGPSPIRENLSEIYTPNALAYVHSLLVPEVDFFAVEFTAADLENGGLLHVSTLTPFDGEGEPGQTVLDPMVRIYDFEGTQVASDDNSADGRNADLVYAVPAAAVSRTYYIAILASNFPPGNPTRGEYVATIVFTEGAAPFGITVNKTSVMTEESGVSDTFTVVLDKAPTADVFIGISSSEPTEGLVSTGAGTPGMSLTLTFTDGNWNTPQEVTVTGVDDAVDDGDVPYSIVIAAAIGAAEYMGIDADDVSATNIDDDTAGITVNPTEGLITTEGGGIDTFEVVLDSEPTSNVTIDISTGDDTEGLVSSDGATQVNSLFLTFTGGEGGNWSTPQTVTVHGQEDPEADLDVAYTIVTAAATGASEYVGINAADVSVTNIDNDTAITTYVSIDVPKNIRSLKTVTSTLTVSESHTIVDVDVQLNIKHSYDSDLHVFLILTPSGGGSDVRVELFTKVGGSGNNFEDTILDDEADTAITAGGAPFIGSYRPEGLLSDFDGMSVNGVWTIEIFDDFRQDNGKLNSWQIMVTHATAGGMMGTAGTSTSAAESTPAAASKGNAAVDAALLSVGVEAAASQSAVQSAFSEEQTVLPQLLSVSPAIVIDPDSDLEISDSQEDSVTDVEGTAFPDEDSSDVAFDALFADFEESLADSLLR